MQVAEVITSRRERLKPLDLRRQLVMVVEGAGMHDRIGSAEGVRIERKSETGLAQVVETGRAAGAFPRLIQCREQHPGEDCDDRYDD